VSLRIYNGSMPNLLLDYFSAEIETEEKMEIETKNGT